MRITKQEKLESILKNMSLNQSIKIDELILQCGWGVANFKSIGRFNQCYSSINKKLTQFYFERKGKFVIKKERLN